MLRGSIHANHTLVSDVVALVLTGGENLTIVTWALETGQPLDDVVDILTLLDVNARRLPRFTCLSTSVPTPTLLRTLPRPDRQNSAPDLGAEISAAFRASRDGRSRACLRIRTPSATGTAARECRRPARPNT